MKKLLAIVTVALSLATFGAWEKVGVIQVADVTTLVGGITKIGEFTGNASIGLMASSYATQMPWVELFGPGRAKAPFSLTVFWNGEEVNLAVLYPVAKTQQEFLELHPGTVGANGVIALKDDEASDDGDGDTDGYVKFSEDGKWAVCSDSAEVLDLTLKDIKIVERPMKGDLAKLVIGKRGMNVVRKMLKEVKTELAANDVDEKSVKRLFEIVDNIETVACGVGVDDSGLAIRGSLKPISGSKLAQCGLKPVADNPLAFADASALCATATGADCGQSFIDVDGLRKLLESNGIKMDFLALEEKDGASKFTLDIPAAITYFQESTKSNSFDKIDGDKMLADLQQLCVGFDTFKVENPPMKYSFAIKGFTTTATPAERLKTVLPELANKKPYQVQVISIYGIIRAVLPHVLNAMDAEERAALEPILATLPPLGNGGTATAIWREKDAHRMVLRVSADEFKSISAGFTAFAAYMMQQEMKQSATRRRAASAIEDDDEDDDDEDDDEAK